MVAQNEVIQQLFRREFAKMVAVISRLYGLDNISVAEDVVSETFLQAVESWHKSGLPPNPTAWLYAVAKQKTLYYFRRNRIYNNKVLPKLHLSQELITPPEEPDFSESHIRDSQLKMMFAICDPAIASEAQIALALRILCGFGIDEIADAFLTNKETVNKRLYRAKEKLRVEAITLEGPSPAAIEPRVESVLRIIYLLFNEGYYSTSNNITLRQDLCAEALRLAISLTEYPDTDLPETHALIALVCFHASRFTARNANEPGSILYAEQDAELWDQELISRGMYHLNRSAAGDNLTSYHLEAGIAFWHSQKQDSPEKWQQILQNYDLLLKLNDSPMVALNRAYAHYMVHGKQAAIKEVEQLQLLQNQFYFTLLGELYHGIDDKLAAASIERAIGLARSDNDRELLKTRLESVRGQNGLT